MNANSIFEKYRPNTWNELIGQDAIVKRVDTIRQRFGGLGGKAYWLTGASGTGKSTAARLIANEVAQCEFGVMELDASDLTAEFLRDYDRRTVGRPLGGNGWAFIANEAHLLSKAQIGKLLTVIEPPGGLPAYVVWCFTTTNSGEEKLFAGCDDAGPLLSRCIQLPLARRDLARPFAERAQQIARLEGLDGKPIEAYIRLVQKHRQNFRAVLQEIASGAMLDCPKGERRLKTLTDILRERMKGRTYEISQATGTQYRVAREFVLGERDPRLSAADKWCTYLGHALTDSKPKTKGQRNARSNTGKRKRTGKQ